MQLLSQPFSRKLSATKNSDCLLLNRVTAHNSCVLAGDTQCPRWRQTKESRRTRSGGNALLWHCFAKRFVNFQINARNCEAVLYPRRRYTHSHWAQQWQGTNSGDVNNRKDRAITPPVVSPASFLLVVCLFVGLPLELVVVVAVVVVVEVRLHQRKHVRISDWRLNEPMRRNWRPLLGNSQIRHAIRNSRILERFNN